MPNVARTVGRSKMIKQYHQRCREEEYQPLGRSTLYRILTVREASQRKSLQGLDNTAASGAEGFDTLSRIVDALEQYGTRHEWCEESRDKLKEAKSYRKSNYCAHYRDDMENLYADHCRENALSDTQCVEFTSPCTRAHAEQCENCQLLRNTMRYPSCLRLKNHTMSSSTAQTNRKTSCTMLSKHRPAFSSGRPTFSEQQIRIVRKRMFCCPFSVTPIS